MPGILVVDGVHSETPRAFQIERAVVDEETLFGRALRDVEGGAKDQFFRFARSNVAGAEEDKKVPSQMERVTEISRPAKIPSCVRLQSKPWAT